MIDLLKSQLLTFFPNAKTIILWGSAVGEDYNEDLGDVDVLIVLDEVDIEKTQKQLQNLINNFKNQINLDPAVISLSNLKKDFQAVTPFKARQLHGMDCYQIKHFGKVIYGDEKVLELIPQISIDQALRDVLPRIKNIFIPRILRELESTQCINELIHEDKDIFFVLARTLYTLRTEKIASKIKSLEFLSDKYPNFLPLFSLLKSVYKKEKWQGKVDKKLVAEFVKIVSKKDSP